MVMARVVTAGEFLARIESRRVIAQAGLVEGTRSGLGQFFTPMPAATLIASLPRAAQSSRVRVLDPGAGVGCLTAAFVARLVAESPGVAIEIVAVEVDPGVARHLEETLAECVEFGAGAGSVVTTRLLQTDLIDLVTGFGRIMTPLDPFDLVVMNPPYRKLSASERTRLVADGFDSPNLYSTFLSVGANVLAPGGQLVAITPRSFANGTYFQRFRRSFLTTMRLDRLHVFDSRSSVFADGGVLQENVIFSTTKTGDHASVVISRSHSTDDALEEWTVPYTAVVDPADRHSFMRIPTGEDDGRTIGSLTHSLADLGLQASTGRVVDFRARQHLGVAPRDGTVPMIYPSNLREGRISWPRPEAGKPQSLIHSPDTDMLRVPGERYVLVKRFSAKEERRRVVAAVYEPDDLPTGDVGFDNKLNYFHAHGRGIDRDLARGLCLWLNSTVLDRHFRTFSGHTQVNAGDLRAMPYPSRVALAALGSAWGDSPLPDQSKIDALVDEHVFGVTA